MEEKASEKFDIILRILPKLAAKTSSLVGKPVPDLTPVITRIMDVVNVETTANTDPNRVRVATEITNYTPRARVLEMFVEMPRELFPKAKFDPAPDGTDPELGRAWWTLPRMEPNTRRTVALEFPKGTEVDATDLPCTSRGSMNPTCSGPSHFPAIGTSGSRAR